MNASAQHCASCGFLLEPDCDFCPGCGSARSKPSYSPRVATEPHAWMKDPPSAQPRTSAPLVQPAAAPQIQYVPYAVPAPVANTQDSGLPATVRTMGIVAVALMLIGFIPCLGWLNYLNITFSFVTIILSIVALASAKSDSARGSAVLGLALVVVAICAGIGRLIIGAGCF